VVQLGPNRRPRILKQLLGILLALAGLAAALGGTREIDSRRQAQLRRSLDVQAQRLQSELPDALALAQPTLGAQLDQALAASETMWLVAFFMGLEARSLDAYLSASVKSDPWWQLLGEQVLTMRVVTGRDQLAEGLAAAVPGETSTVAVERGLPWVRLGAVNGKAHVAAAYRLSGLVSRSSIVATQFFAITTELPAPRLMINAVAHTGGAVALTDGANVLLSGGNASDVSKLASTMGQADGGSLWRAPDSEWVAVRHDVGGGLAAWAFAPAGPSALLAREEAATIKGAVWVGSGVLVLVGLVLIFSGLFKRRGEAVPRGPKLSSLPPPSDRITPISLDAEASAPWATPPANAASSSGHGYAQPAGQSNVSGRVSTHSSVELPTLGRQTDSALVPLGDSAQQERVSHALAPIALGRYLLLAPLGAGGMAEVFKAVSYGSAGFRRRFVIKRLRAEFLRQEEAVTQFVDEATLASSLVHSNIVPVLDFGEADGEYYMASEYIQGRDLTRLVTRHVEHEGRGLAPGLVIRLASELLQGLDFVHKKHGDDGLPLGLVHRDVSPGNVMVSMGGEVKLLDFGIVKAERRATHTQQGLIKGNLLFMSPEQARAHAVDARSDLFSLGMVMYFAAKGEPLYDEDNQYDLLVRAAAGPQAKEHDKFDALPAPLPGLLHRALAPNPADRFPSANAFLKHLGALMSESSYALNHVMQVLFGGDLAAEERSFASCIAQIEKGQIPEPMRQRMRNDHVAAFRPR